MPNQSTQSNSAKPFVAKLNRARELRKQTGTGLHERVTLLTEVFADSEYRTKLEYELKVDVLTDDVVASALDEFLDDLVPLGYDFMVLKTILHFFPAPEDWASGNLVQMWEQSQVKQEESPREPARTVRRATLAELKEWQEKYAALEKKYSQACQKVVELEAELDGLRTEALAAV